MHPRHSLIGCLAVLCASAPPARSEAVQAELAGSHIVRLTAGGTTFEMWQLTPGHSTGTVSFNSGNPPSFPAAAADNLNLATYFARADVGDDPWVVELDDWVDVNGAGQPDFFLFEAGGNDALMVSAVLADGTVGQPVPVSGWTPTGFAVTTGPNQGQVVHGLAFHSTDLRDAAGATLPVGTVLSGIHILSPSVDGASFTAVSPDAQPGDGTDGDGSVVLTGQLVKWHTMELSLFGPWSSELDVAPNPFLDYRMTVTFTGPRGQVYVVPGFFDGDGRGRASGRIFKVRFAPDMAGPWNAKVSFRYGTDVAIDLSPSAGSLTPWDGASIDFKVAELDRHAPGFLRWGRLEYVGTHYRKFVDGPFFLKGGSNSPENFLAYWGFDDVQDSGNLGIIHRFEPHVADWQEGDPLFVSETTGYDSKGIIGALNYLSNVGVNSLFLLPMNLGGDGQDITPFVGYGNTSFNKTHYDISRLNQWIQVFEHAQRRGITLQFVLAETEPQNETWLDFGGFGRERKLFFREMIARFGHLLAVKWNLSEENDFSVTLLRQMADYIDALDAFDHPVTFHNHLNDLSDYNQVLGEDRFVATSCQYTPPEAGNTVETLRSASLANGHPWVVELDENAPWNVGLMPDNATELRKQVLYDVYFSGGQIEWYMGFHELPIGGDLTVEDFRSREDMWRYMNYARRVVERYMPFHRMAPADNLLTGETGLFGGGEVFALRGSVYAVYLPSASSTGSLDLTGAEGVYLQRWYNPRTGYLEGAGRVVNGGGAVPLMSPPSESDQDWVTVLRRVDIPVPAPLAR